MGGSASQFQEIAGSGIEINPENETQREGDQIIEMGSVSRLECETVANDGMWARKEGPIARP